MDSVQAVPIYDTAQRKSAPLEEAREVFRYRNLVFQMVRRDIVARYKRSVLGITWTMLNPLGMMIVLSVVFSQVFRTDHTFPVYILSGLVAWTFFSQTISDAMVNLITGVNLLQRIYMPPTAFALASLGNGLVNLTISLVPLTLVMLVIGLVPKPAFLFFPISMVFLAFFALGMGLLLSTLSVYFRDVVAMFQVVLTAWMYLTPIIYPEEVLDPPFRFWIATLNPMYSLVKLFRIPIYEGRIPMLGEIWPAAALSLFVMVVGWIVFTRKSHEFAYRI